MKLRFNLDALLFPDGYDLLSACKQDDLEKVKALLAANPTLVYYSSIFNGQTAWHQAAVHGSRRVLEEMALYVQSHRERLAKYYFAKAGCFQTTRLNFKGGEINKAVNQENNRQQTPLMLAAAASQPDCVRILIRAGADLNARDSGLRTALHYAAYSGCSASCGQIIAAAQEAAASHPRLAHHIARFVDRRTICGFTALHYAVYHSHVDCAQQLLFAGASLLARCTWSGAIESIWCDPQCTPLHLAARTGNVTMVKLLLQALISRFGSLDVPRSIDPRAQRDRSGRQPYHYVLLSRPHSPLVHLLHPATPLADAFSADELAAILVEPSPTLAQIAAAAHTAHLRVQLEGLLRTFERSCDKVESEEQPPASCLTDSMLDRIGMQDGSNGHGGSANNGSDCGSGSSSSSSSSSSSIVVNRMSGSRSTGGGASSSASNANSSSTTTTSSGSSTSDGGDSSECWGSAHEAGSKDDSSTGTSNSDQGSSAQEAAQDGCAAGGQCGVCWTQKPALQLNSCGHQLCGTCSLKICEVQAPKIPLCPFCRGPIRSFTPSDPSRPSLEITSAAGPSQQ